MCSSITWNSGHCGRRYRYYSMGEYLPRKGQPSYIPECCKFHLHWPGLGAEGGNNLALLLDEGVQLRAATAPRPHWLWGNAHCTAAPSVQTGRMRWSIAQLHSAATSWGAYTNSNSTVIRLLPWIFKVALPAHEVPLTEPMANATCICLSSRLHIDYLSPPPVCSSPCSWEVCLGVWAFAWVCGCLHVGCLRGCLGVCVFAWMCECLHGCVSVCTGVWVCGWHSFQGFGLEMSEILVQGVWVWGGEMDAGQPCVQATLSHPKREDLCTRWGDQLKMNISHN